MQWAKIRFFPQFFFFEDKIKAPQVQHTFGNDYFDVVLGNVRKI